MPLPMYKVSPLVPPVPETSWYTRPSPPPPLDMACICTTTDRHPDAGGASVPPSSLSVVPDPAVEPNPMAGPHFDPITFGPPVWESGRFPCCADHTDFPPNITRTRPRCSHFADGCSVAMPLIESG